MQTARGSGPVHPGLAARVGKLIAAEFLRKLIEALPSRIHTILTDNGIQFTHCERDRFAMAHSFTRIPREEYITSV